MIDAVPVITAQRFNDLLVTRLQTDAADWKSFVKRYSDNKKWTKQITNLVESICYEDLGFESVTRESWPRVDVAAYSRATDTDWDEWALEIAIEMENDSTTWESECHKLLLLSCGLKVLVTYEGAENNDELERRLSRFVEIYRSRKYCRKNDQWLLVFLPWHQDVTVYSEIRSFELINQKDERGQSDPFLRRLKVTPLRNT